MLKNLEAKSKFEITFEKAFAEKKVRNGISSDNPFS
jgi:hypothetical protein